MYLAHPAPETHPAPGVRAGMRKTPDPELMSPDWGLPESCGPFVRRSEPPNHTAGRDPGRTRSRANVALFPRRVAREAVPTSLEALLRQVLAGDNPRRSGCYMPHRDSSRGRTSPRPRKLGQHRVRASSPGPYSGPIETSECQCPADPMILNHRQSPHRYNPPACEPIGGHPPGDGQGPRIRCPDRAHRSPYPERRSCGPHMTRPDRDRPCRTDTPIGCHASGRVPPSPK